MGNITIKSKLEDIFDYWNIPIVITIRDNLNKIIYSNTNGSKLKQTDYCLIDTFNLDCTTYNVYTANTLFEKYKTKTFIISFEELNQVKEIYNYISGPLLLYFGIGNDIRELYNLFDIESLRSFKKSIAESIIKSKFNFVWNGKIFYKNKYERFQIDGVLEYSRNIINGYFNVANIEYLYENNVKCVHYIENLDLTNKNISLPLIKNSMAIDIKNYVNKWLNKNKIYNFYIDDNIDKYIIIDIGKLDDLFYLLINTIKQFELWCNPFYLIMRLETYHIMDDLSKIIYSMGGKIYRDNSIVEIRLPYKKDKLSDMRPGDIKTKIKPKENDSIIHLIDKNLENRLELKKHLEKRGYKVCENRDLSIEGFNTKNNILIYNIDDNYEVNKLREKGVIMPIIISDNPNFQDRFYNYKLSYPFKKSIIDETLNNIITRVNILYFDRDIRSSLLTKKILDKSEQYNIYIEKNIHKIEEYTVMFDIQLIIIDSSIVEYYNKTMPQKIIQGSTIPVLYLDSPLIELEYRLYTIKLRKPFNAETLNKNIIECFS